MGFVILYLSAQGLKESSNSMGALILAINGNVCVNMYELVLSVLFIDVF